MGDPLPSPHGVAIVGAGRMGDAHATAWAALGVPIRAVVSPRRRPALAAAPDARWATTLDDVLADPRVTIVSICTPTPSHASLAIRALEAGRHVLLEKPIALTVPDARAVADAAERAAGILMVAHVVRFFRGYAELAERVAAGSVGEVRAVRATRLSAAPTWASWLEDDEQSGGMVVDFAIHDFDQANLLLGAPVAVRSIRVGAAAGAGESAFGEPVATTIEYAGGGVAQVLSAADLPEGFAFGSTLDVVGSDGVDAVVGDGGDPFVEQARYFLRCVETGSEPFRSPVTGAVDALRVALAARRSLRSGDRETVAGA
ncbi:Gfo/Idh/MocA family protein [Leifsonia poae]|uniref:Dehydrogenase n=1 Tax=Leifsonia poae TaxID=110933 RepID=A0A9W6HAQ7_9MICO|nr:Gfo/Idh/MocA family oxidoreductase [Leifsonia poae]GLJ76452.1 dehydrogenase [Leifsonia poae]